MPCWLTRFIIAKYQANWYHPHVQYGSDILLLFLFLSHPVIREESRRIDNACTIIFIMLLHRRQASFYSPREVLTFQGMKNRT